MTSSDGFCSCLTFAPGELGQVYHGAVFSPIKPPPQPLSFINTAASSQTTTPTPTPTTTHVPPLVRQPSTGFPASPSPFAPVRPASPARSMSASSIATQSSMAPGADQNGVVNNPTPSLGTLPSIAAAHSGPVGGMPLWTPPQTPMPGGASSHSATSSISGPAGTGLSRPADSEELKRRERGSDAGVEDEHQPKKRRIAPTLMTEGEESASTSAPGPESS